MSQMPTKPVLIGDIDLAIDAAAAKYEKTATVTVEFAEQDGMIETLEGMVPYIAGDAILTGIKGEKWPVRRRVFDSLYECASGNNPKIYTKKAGSYIFAKQMMTPFCVQIIDGKAALEGKSGDWLVQFSPGELGIVAHDIFMSSYRRLE